MNAEPQIRSLDEKDFLNFLRASFGAFKECSDKIQGVVKDMIEIVIDPESDEEEVALAINTIGAALYPQTNKGILGMEIMESEEIGASHSVEMRQAVEDLHREEAEFAENLRSAMKERGMTQGQLASLVGVGQPAISNMLRRQCRPQRRTIEKISRALDVEPEELWPSFE